ncbi:MAG TPA: peptide deformylase [Gaiellaceae bacterium]|jgi:peptide deformylase|nr:peptide deformylase [Gaiellaceae bacterium]
MGEVEGQVRSEELDAEREARRRLALAQVRQYPDPVLRMKANEVDELDESVTGLVERMKGLMSEARGVGLAAPQLGILRRVLVYQAGEEEPFVALVNPRVLETSEERIADDEGCLSLGAASVIVEVERPLSIVVEGKSPEGADVRIEAEGLEARVIQHELDHLDGILIIDRTSPEHRREALAKLRPQPVLGPAG